MMTIWFLKSSSGECEGFSMQGHTEYAEPGEDIVCAAVSSAAFMTTNTITDILKAEAQVSAEDGRMFMRISKNDVNRCREILEGFKLHLLGLEEQYPQSINVNYMEV